MRLRILAVALALSGCAHSSALTAALPPFTLQGTDGERHVIVGSSARLTVLIFSDWKCPCQLLHDGRLRDLYARYHAQGVDFFAVDSEVGASVDADAEQASKRAYPFPVLVDAGGALARKLHAEYATESFILDRRGVVRYHGGIDGDRHQLHDDTRPVLRDAVDDLLADRTPRITESKAFGCALQIW